MAFISGIGWVTARSMGCGKDHDRFEMSEVRLAAVDRKAIFEQPYKNYGRMDEYSRVGLAGIAFALRDAGLESWTDRRNIGIIAATEYGCLWTDFAYFETVLPQGGKLASPNLFAYTLPNCFLGEAAIRYGLAGESFVIYDSRGDGLASLRLALDSIDAAEADQMLCGTCDLGRPSKLQAAAEVPCGSLFLVLEKELPSDRSAYGSLSQDETGQLLFNQRKIAHLFELVDACLHERSTALPRI